MRQRQGNLYMRQNARFPGGYGFGYARPPYRRPRGKRAWLPAVLAALALVLGAAFGAGLALWMRGLLPWQGAGAPSPAGSVAVPPAGQSTPAAAPGTEESSDGLELGEVIPRNYTAIPLPGEMRAVWISFLEWKQMNFSGEAAARTALGTIFDNCRAIGINTVITAVRPFGDALYKSALFPYSHTLGGAQGQDPGFDPLALMTEEAHARGLRIEAWLNPYRVQDTINGPGALSADNPARLHPEWVCEENGNLWYNPGLPQVQKLVRDGVLEIVQNYDVDGIHFDDYFYPESAERDASFDAGAFAAYGGGQTLEAWRRANVDTLMQAVYAAVKAANPTASFGVSPQGNNENNYVRQYSDVKKWMSTPGFIDYVMPQLYWGFGYRTQSGREQFAFENIAAEWAFYPRDASVRLYAGLGAYRIGLLQPDGSREGQGDGGSNDQTEWASGRNLADMVAALRAQDGFSGAALFRYAFLFQPNDALSESERAALRELFAT